MSDCVDCIFALKLRIPVDHLPAAAAEPGPPGAAATSLQARFSREPYGKLALQPRQRFDAQDGALSGLPLASSPGGAWQRRTAGRMVDVETSEPC